MYDPEATDRRGAALAWLRANPKANPFQAALAGHTVTAHDCEAARRAAADEPPAGTAWDRYVAATGTDPSVQEHIAHAEGTAHAFERRRDRSA